MKQRWNVAKIQGQIFGCNRGLGGWLLGSEHWICKDVQFECIIFIYTYVLCYGKCLFDMKFTINKYASSK